MTQPVTHHRRTTGEFKVAIRRHAGNLTAVAEELGVMRSTVVARIRREPELAEFLNDLEESLLDKAVSVVNNAISNGDVATARWLLQQKGISRGFGNKVEVSGPDGGPVRQEMVVTIRYVDVKPVIEGEAREVRR